MKKIFNRVLFLQFLFSVVAWASPLSLKDVVSSPSDFPVVMDGRGAGILIDQADAEVVKVAAKLFADDVERVSGIRPEVGNDAATVQRSPVIIAGTLGKSPLVDRLAAAGKLKGLAKIQGKWEATLWQIVEQPFPDVERALVIVGSDRRGTAYGIMRLSEVIGVSAWYWWADVPTPRHMTLVVSVPSPETDAPAVKYRGIFINDEDWGLHEWAKNTFEPEIGGIGPKTYEKVFELMLRLRLNYIWPAMHEISKEFHSIPENITLADRYGIVAGASHCEPMLYNNANWKESERGKWDYQLNRETIFSVWEEQVKTRGDKEAVWGLGIRGIHDRGMQGPKNIRQRIAILEEVLKDQRDLLEKHVSKEWGPVAQAFVPYKEVLTLYDAGLKIPDDVTLVWVNDNFGYIRRLGKPEERKRSGGAGVYWHLSYYGAPHSYLWLNTTAPALMWEELHKAWENDARNMWVVNVGDIKPMEIGIDYFAKFAWNPENFGPDSQPRFLRAFAAEQFGEELAQRIADLLGEFYRLGTIRKPELMTREWALSLTDENAAQLRLSYENLIKTDAAISSALPVEMRDAYFEMVGFPAKIMGATGLIFMTDRSIQFGDKNRESAEEITRHRAFIDKYIERFNEVTAKGKWGYMMPGAVTARNLNAWNSQVRWPWGGKPAESPTKPQPETGRLWRDAASADRQTSAGKARWTTVSGLGHSGRAVALKPASLDANWKEDDTSAPSLEFDFEASGGDTEVFIDFLPTFRIYPGTKLRVSVSIDNQTPAIVEVPGSDGREDERGANRREGVQNNYVRSKLSFPNLSAGKHVFKIRAIDAGSVIDRICLPSKSTN
ncbi:MAG: glycosyl hydrolase 115 family protein [Luteolibacter sp.]